MDGIEEDEDDDAEARIAAARAKEKGYQPNCCLWDHALNGIVDGHEDNLHLPGKAGGVTADLVAKLRQLAEEAKLPLGCQGLRKEATLQEFLSRRESGMLTDPLDILRVATPALSPLQTYKQMCFSLHDAICAEWALGPEHPLPRQGLEMGEALLTYHPSLYMVLTETKPTPYLSGCDEDRLLALTKLFGTIALKSRSDITFTGPFGGFPAVDRSGKLSSGLRLKVVWPLPAFEPEFCLTLPEVMSRRVQELLTKHPRLQLMWSGGIDTTAILTAFMRTLGLDAASWDRAGVSVHYTKRSISEHPRFYERYLKHLPGGQFPGHVRDFIDGSRVVVSGEPADMLFGTTWMARAFKYRHDGAGTLNPVWYALGKPWEAVIPPVLRLHRLLAPGDLEEQAWFAWIQPWVDASPIKVVTVFDFCWWVAFGLKWQHDMVRTFLNRDHVTQELWDSVEHFYCTTEWQQWGYHNHEAKMPDKSCWATYKEPLKRYIRDFDGDDEYYHCKIKVPSATYGFGYQLGLDDAFHSITFGGLCISRARMLEKYGDRLHRYLVDGNGTSELEAADRARELGFAPNNEAFAHPLNNDRDAEKDDGLDPPIDRPLLQRVEEASAMLSELGNKGFPYADMGVEMSYLEFLHARYRGELTDPLDVFGLHTPAISDFPDYAGLRLSMRRALELEWAAGPERPLSAAEPLGSALLAYHHSLPFLLRNRSPNPWFCGSDADRLMGLVRSIGKNTGGFSVVDRTGTLSCGLRVHNRFPMPPYNPSFSLSLEEVMSMRVDGLLKKHTRLHLLWSGGIDTTAILIAFFRVVGFDRDSWERHGLSVHYGQRSIQEHPDFYQRFVVGLPGGVIDDSLRNFIDGTRVVVAGTPADQLFSTAWFRRAFTIRTVQRSDGTKVRNPMWYGLHRPWQEAMPEILRAQGCLSSNQEDEEAWMEWVTPWVEKSPIPVKDVFDFGWWVSFSLKWQYDCLRVFLNRDVCSEALIQSVEHFYASDGFQQWMYVNHASRILDRGVYASFKEPLKRFIRDFDGDGEYYRAKCKVASVQMHFGYQLGLTDSCHVLRCGLLSMSRQRMVEKYGQELQCFLEDREEC